MCGIIGVTGAPDPYRLLLDGITLLEYRGYDSAGLAIVDPVSDRLWRARAAERSGSIARLEGRVDDVPSASGAGIGHTRWATHGAPTERNAHPHVDCSGRLGLVHNGIIENHRELAEKLVADGHVFTSETDTEVLAHLVEDHLARGLTLAEGVRSCLALVRGDFAVALVHADFPDVLVAARRTSPLVIGLTEEAGFVASDLAALIGSTRDLFTLGDDQVVEVRPGMFRVLDAAGQEVRPPAIEVAWSVDAAQKCGYPDFMSKEMREQPIAVSDTLLGRVEPDGSTGFEELELSGEELAGIDRVLLVACGSSYHAALLGRHAVESLARVPAEADIASEFRYRNPVLDERTLVVTISQSGETTDTFHALREAKRRGARTLAVTNVVDSLMAREADGVLYTRAGPEIGVASTKCHLAQLALMQCFGLHLANARGALDAVRRAEVASGLLSLPDLVAATLERSDEHEAVARMFAHVRDFYFLGRRIGFPVALEGALKLKELAYVRAEAYAAGEMKHGPISLIEPGAVVIAIATRGELWEKVMSNVEEVRARGATIVAVADAGDDATAGLVDAVLEVPRAAESVSAPLAVVALQSFAYAIARARGNDVDRPRNLAKVVTVE